MANFEHIKHSSSFLSSFGLLAATDEDWSKVKEAMVITPNRLFWNSSCVLFDCLCTPKSQYNQSEQPAIRYNWGTM